MGNVATRFKSIFTRRLAADGAAPQPAAGHGTGGANEPRVPAGRGCADFFRSAASSIARKLPSLPRRSAAALPVDGSSHRTQPGSRPADSAPVDSAPVRWHEESKVARETKVVVHPGKFDAPLATRRASAEPLLDVEAQATWSVRVSPPNGVLVDEKLASEGAHSNSHSPPEDRMSFSAMHNEGFGRLSTGSIHSTDSDDTKKPDPGRMHRSESTQAFGRASRSSSGAQARGNVSATATAANPRLVPSTVTFFAPGYDTAGEPRSPGFNPAFNRVLADPHMRQCLREHMYPMSLESLEFMEACETYFQTGDPDVRAEQFKAIFETHLHPDSPFLVNMITARGKAALDALKAIQSGTTPFNHVEVQHLLDEAFGSIYFTLTTPHNVWVQFLHSEHGRRAGLDPSCELVHETNATETKAARAGYWQSTHPALNSRITALKPDAKFLATLQEPNQVEFLRDCHAFRGLTNGSERVLALQKILDTYLRDGAAKPIGNLAPGQVRALVAQLDGAKSGEGTSGITDKSPVFGLLEGVERYAYNRAGGDMERAQEERANSSFLRKFSLRSRSSGSGARASAASPSGAARPAGVSTAGTSAQHVPESKSGSSHLPPGLGEIANPSGKDLAGFYAACRRIFDEDADKPEVLVKRLANEQQFESRLHGLQPPVQVAWANLKEQVRTSGDSHMAASQLIGLL
jgi:hypothetical protein